uniref:dCTP pyrophosphatase 1 n=1 Tax=Chromera velia CCMP2878 TaxID=1169474 RepID=A0A0G4FN29_9ALVE|eukprot:Cvel_17785.t1-p1 / transcript=Cvel_17785.t1 / gene=Cvel_17785 / organism=Chromera_velia_CCMP2878 / gene_product=dCTP pyrophosphatase 1, putative / transcript_product=dCTP pyrophosphatase 1, putative / location=Cvel_scaffold1438:34144-36888(-) / protein_length=172 / sequence_SO=supercontig / SO=protein_coding / is_pseudo=false
MSASTARAVEGEKETGPTDGSGSLPSSSPAAPPSPLTLEELRDCLRNFAVERDWDQFHTPRNLLCALVGEVGELSEIFQWKGEVQPGLPDFREEEKFHVGEEISDCLMYLVRLADRCGVDLSEAVSQKLQKNARKYPAKLTKGSSRKYNEYSEEEVMAAARTEVEKNQNGHI